MKILVVQDYLRSGGTERQSVLLANAFAQAEGLLAGRSSAEASKQLADQGKTGPKADEQARHMEMPGNRGSTTLLLNALTPEAVGALIALYEHRTFAAGILWGINPFDQWGVELGKELATQLVPMVRGSAQVEGRDGSTESLIKQLKKLDQGFR